MSYSINYNIPPIQYNPAPPAQTTQNNTASNDNSNAYYNNSQYTDNSSQQAAAPAIAGIPASIAINFDGKNAQGLLGAIQNGKALLSTVKAQVDATDSGGEASSRYGSLLNQLQTVETSVFQLAALEGNNNDDDDDDDDDNQKMGAFNVNLTA